MTTRHDFAALAAVLAERARQDAKWGEQNHDNFVWGAILGEEVGEAAQAALWANFANDGEPYTDAEVAAEVTQVAAVAISWLGAIARRHPNRRRVYVAGPIAGKEDANRAAFAAAAESLRGQGYDAVNPHEVEPHAHPGECPSWGYFPGENDRDHTSSCCFMRTDLIALLTCDYIHLLDGWQQSKGASFEREVARVCGIEVLG